LVGFAGNVIETSRTKKDIKTEICSNCHPFITGKQRLVDTLAASRNSRKSTKPKWKASGQKETTHVIVKKPKE